MTQAVDKLLRPVMVFGAALLAGACDLRRSAVLDPKGPIALAHLSSRVPAGFHGNWRPGTL